MSHGSLSVLNTAKLNIVAMLNQAHLVDLQIEATNCLHDNNQDTDSHGKVKMNKWSDDAKSPWLEGEEVKGR